MSLRLIRSEYRPGRIAGIAALILVLAAAPIGGTAKAQKAAAVGVDRVQSQTISQTFPVIGRFVSLRSGVVAARVRGAVEVMRVRVGDRIRVGTVIASLIRNRLKWAHELRQADLTEQKAELDTARAEMKMVTQELARLKRLKKNRSAAFRQARYDDKLVRAVMMKSGIAKATARQLRARANLNLARIDLEEAEIRAP